MPINKQTATARLLTLSTVLVLIFAFLVTPTLAESPDTYQTSRFTSDERVDDSVGEYAQSAEKAGFILKRKESSSTGREWARLGGRQDEEGPEKVAESSDKVSLDFDLSRSY